MKGNTKVMALFLCVLFLIAPFISLVGAAQTENRSVSRATNHIVLGEIMTGTWCTWCKYAEQAFDLLAKDPSYFDTRLVMIEWHNNDPYSIPEEATRMAYYGGTGYPMAVFDGHYGMAGAANDGTGNYTKGTLDAYKAMIDPRPITANASISINLGLSGNKLTAWVNATLLQDTTLTNLKVWAVLIEDENFWDGLYPIRMTARDVIFSTAVSITKSGEVGKGTGTMTLDSKWDLGKLKVVGFIQSDSTGFILQAGISTPPPTLKGSPTVTMNENTIDTSLNLDNLFTDPMGKAFTYYGAKGSAHINATVNPTTHIASIQPWNNWSGNEDIYLQVADNTSMPCNGKIPVMVTHINQAPVLIKAIPAQTMKEGTTKTNAINLNSYFYDCDDQSFTFTASGATNVTTKITAGQVSITAPVGFFGSDKITFKATDAGGLSASGDCTVTVTDVNFPPKLLKAIPDVTMNEDTVDKSIKLSEYFSDIDSPELTYTFDGLTDIQITAGTDTVLTITPKADWNGIETVTVSASDTINTAVKDTFTITVTPVNDGPILSGTAFETVKFSEDTDYTTEKTINSLFTDKDGPAMTYSADPGDSDLTITLNSDYTVSFHPAANWNGERAYWIRATDGQYMIQYNATVKVEAVNDPPHIDSYIPTNPPSSINEGDSVDYNIVASDVVSEKETLTYTWTSNDKAVGENAAAYKFTTDYNSTGKYTIKVVVSDGELTASHTWSLTVKNVNRKPSVEITAPAATGAFRSDTPITFTALGTDPDGDTVTYQWSVDGASVGTGASVTSTLLGGAHTVKVVASDGKGGSAEKTMSITVKAIKKNTGNTGMGGMLLYGLIAVIVAVIVVVALVLMMRKKKPQPAEPTAQMAPLPPPPSPYQPQPPAPTYDPNAGYNPPQTYDPNAGYYPPPPPQ